MPGLACLHCWNVTAACCQLESEPPGTIANTAHNSIATAWGTVAVYFFSLQNGWRTPRRLYPHTRGLLKVILSSGLCRKWRTCLLRSQGGPRRGRCRSDARWQCNPLGGRPSTPPWWGHLGTPRPTLHLSLLLRCAKCLPLKLPGSYCARRPPHTGTCTQAG